MGYRHSWARTPRILRARGGLLHKVRTLLQWDPEARGGGFITLTPCVPRYGYRTTIVPEREEMASLSFFPPFPLPQVYGPLGRKGAEKCCYSDFPPFSPPSSFSLRWRAEIEGVRVWDFRKAAGGATPTYRFPIFPPPLTKPNERLRFFPFFWSGKRRVLEVAEGGFKGDVDRWGGFFSIAV